jgi:hypothetical protein
MKRIRQICVSALWLTLFVTLAGCTPLERGLNDGINKGISAALSALIQAPIELLIDQWTNGAS